MTAALGRALEDKSWRQSTIERGLARSADYTWQRTTNTLVDVFRDSLPGTGNRRRNRRRKIGSGCVIGRRIAVDARPVPPRYGHLSLHPGVIDPHVSPGRRMVPVLAPALRHRRPRLPNVHHRVAGVPPVLRATNWLISSFRSGPGVTGWRCSGAAAPVADVVAQCPHRRHGARPGLEGSRRYHALSGPADRGFLLRGHWHAPTLSPWCRSLPGAGWSTITRNMPRKWRSYPAPVYCEARLAPSSRRRQGRAIISCLWVPWNRGKAWFACCGPIAAMSPAPAGAAAEDCRQCWLGRRGYCGTGG